MNLPSENQVNSGLRHAGTAAATAVTIFTVLGVIPHDQVQGLIDGLQQIDIGLEQVFGGFSKVVVIVGPIAAAYFTKGAMGAQSLRTVLKGLTTDQGKSYGAPVHIDGQIVVPAAVAEDVPSAKVVGPSPSVAVAGEKAPVK